MAAAGGEDLIGGRALPLISRGLPGSRVLGSRDGSSSGTHRRVWETSSPPCSTCGHHGSVQDSCCFTWQAPSLRAVMPQRTEKCHSSPRPLRGLAPPMPVLLWQSWVEPGPVPRHVVEEGVRRRITTAARSTGAASAHRVWGHASVAWLPWPLLIPGQRVLLHSPQALKRRVVIPQATRGHRGPGRGSCHRAWETHTVGVFPTKTAGLVGRIEESTPWCPPAVGR